MSPNILKIRFNTEHQGKLKWRVVFPDWTELLADEVIFNVPARTTEDLLPNGKLKHHVTMNYENLNWVQDDLGTKLYVS